MSGARKWFGQTCQFLDPQWQKVLMATGMRFMFSYCFVLWYFSGIVTRHWSRRYLRCPGSYSLLPMQLYSIHSTFRAERPRWPFFVLLHSWFPSGPRGRAWPTFQGISQIRPSTRCQCIRALSRKMDPPLRECHLWKGASGFSMKRWIFWKKRFGEIKEHDQASVKTNLRDGRWGRAWGGYEWNWESLSRDEFKIF